MKKRLAGLALPLFVSASGFAQAVLVPVSGGDLLLGAFNKQQTSAFSSMSNVASLGLIDRFSAGMFAERRFMLQDLTVYSLAATLPSGSGCFRTGVDYFGNIDFNQTSLHLAYGRKLAQQLNAGLQFNYSLLRAGTYGYAGVAGVDAGILVKATTELTIGMQMENLASFGSTTENAHLPFSFVGGAGYNLDEMLFLGLVLRKEQNRPLDVLAGISYKASEKLKIHTGINAATASFYFGTAFTFDHITFDISASMHPVLGITPASLILYNASGPE